MFPFLGESINITIFHPYIYKVAPTIVVNWSYDPYKQVL